MGDARVVFLIFESDLGWGDGCRWSRAGGFISWLRRVTLRCILSLCGAPERRFGRPTRWTNKAQRIDNAGMMRLGRPSPPRIGDSAIREARTRLRRGAVVLGFDCFRAHFIYGCTCCALLHRVAWEHGPPALANRTNEAQRVDIKILA